MADDFIKIDPNLTTQKFANDAIDYVRSFEAVIRKGESLKGKMDHMVNGANFSTLETLIGLKAGDGQPFYNLVAGSIAAAKGTTQSADGLTMIARAG